MSTVLRTRRHHQAYKRFAKTLKPGTCDFCNFKMGMDQVIREEQHFWIVKNIFGYDMWDSTGVTDHLMLVPKRHVVGMGDFNVAEQKGFFAAIKEYEAQNYSVYARSPANTRKSVTHQHTHLIKLDGKVKKAIFYLRKPHLLLMK